MSTRTSNVPRVQALDSFLTYMCEEYDQYVPDTYSLADYIHQWLWSGHGVDNCFGDFEIFLKVIPLIVDEWYRDPRILYFDVGDERGVIERRAATVFGDDTNLLHDIFDRDNFTAAAYNWIHIVHRRR
jgi:hypothetical protein